jgi:predicted ATPase/DNA-binding SARP family transcriptional activator
MSDPQYRLHLFGGFRLERDGVTVKFPRRKSEALLAYLALYPQEHAREKLAALFWGDAPDENARRSLRQALSDIRNELGEDTILADRETVQLNPNFRMWTDARDIFDLRFMISDFEIAESQQFINHKSNIINYAELLPDFYDDCFEPPREELRALFLDAALKLIEQARAQSEYKTTMELAQKILTVDKANEAAHQHLMFCYSALGDRAAALDQYEFCKRALRDELGIEPSQETRALFETIRKQTETKSPAARLTNLPRPATSFVGREREIAELRAMFGRGEALTGTVASTQNAVNVNASPLLTILGPGGSGKTRLAIECGAQLVSDFSDGVWWVDFSALQDATLVPYQVAKALGVLEQAHQDLTATLCEFAREKNLLLILDNCEHLIDACAQLVQSLISNSPISILTTSREALNIPGEKIYPIAPLAVPSAATTVVANTLLQFEAIRLFVERARGISPAFVLNDENALTIARICTRLDGIPLAIELAAARVKHLSLQDIAARLDDRFNLLTQGSRAALPRQQTLRALLDWSYNLLDENEKSLFQQLAVFEGGWTLEAVEEIAVEGGGWSVKRAMGSLHAPPSSLLDVVSRLVDKSLVVFESNEIGGRYHFLETIQQYAREQLAASGGAAALRARHSQFFYALVREARTHAWGDDASTWHARVAQETENVRAALGWGLAHEPARALEFVLNMRPFWNAQGALHESIAFLSRALDANSDGEYSKRAQALASLADLYARTAQLERAIAIGKQAVQLLETLDEPLRLANAQHALALAYTFHGEYAESDALEAASLALQQKLNNAQGEMNARLALATNARLRGEYARALALADEILAHDEAHKNQRTRNIAQAFRGGALFNLREYAQAAQELKQAFRGLLVSGQDYAPAPLCWCVQLVAERGDDENAIRLAGAAQTLRERVAMRMPQADETQYQELLDALRARVTRQQWQTWWAQGQQLTLPQLEELLERAVT